MLGEATEAEIVDVLERHRKQATVGDEFDCACGFESDDQEVPVSFEQHVASALAAEVSLFRDLRRELHDVWVQDAEGQRRSALAESFSSGQRVIAPAELVRRS